MVRRLALGVVAVVAAACGRFGFDPVPVDGDGGPIDAGVVDAAGPDAALDGGFGCLEVTTALDENDAGESASPPHQGLGLSLREAIEIANLRTGHDCIDFAGPMRIELLLGELEPLGDLSGTTLDGGDQVVVARPIDLLISVGLNINSTGNVVRRLALEGFEVGINARQGQNQLVDLEISGGDVGVQLAGLGNRLARSFIHDVTASGVQVLATSDGAFVEQLVVARAAAGAGVDVRAGTGAQIRHVTVHGSGVGVQVLAVALATEIANSALVANGIGVQVQAGGAVASLDHSAFSGNTTDCANCTIGASSITADPQFVDPVTDDYRLQAGSPAIDVGIDTGLDVNGAGPGLFNGLAPDLGAFEAP